MVALHLLLRGNFPNKKWLGEQVIEPIWLLLDDALRRSALVVSMVVAMPEAVDHVVVRAAAAIGNRLQGGSIACFWILGFAITVCPTKLHTLNSTYVR
jgi:hypothetical protein